MANFLGLYDLFQRQQRQSSRSPLERDFEQTRPRQPSLSPLEREFERTRPRRPSRSPLERDFEETRRRPSEQDPFDYDAYMREYESERIEDEEGYEIDYDDPDAYLDDIGRSEDPWADDYEILEERLPRDDNETRDDEQWAPWDDDPEVLGLWQPLGWDEYQRLTGPQAPRGGLPDDPNETRDDEQWDAWGAPKAVAGNPYWDEYQRLTGRFPRRSEDPWGDDFEPGRGERGGLPDDPNETRDDEQWDAWGAPKRTVDDIRDPSLLTPSQIEDIYYAYQGEDPLSLTQLQYDIVYGHLRPDFAGGPQFYGDTRGAATVDPRPSLVSIAQEILVTLTQSVPVSLASSIQMEWTDDASFLIGATTFDATYVDEYAEAVLSALTLAESLVSPYPNYQVNLSAIEAQDYSGAHVMAIEVWEGVLRPSPKPAGKTVAVHAFWNEYQRLTGRFPGRSQDPWADDPEPGYDHDDRGGLPFDANESRDDAQWDAWGAPKATIDDLDDDQLQETEGTEGLADAYVSPLLLDEAWREARGITEDPQTWTRAVWDAIRAGIDLFGPGSAWALGSGPLKPHPSFPGVYRDETGRHVTSEGIPIPWDYENRRPFPGWEQLLENRKTTAFDSVRAEQLGFKWPWEWELRIDPDEIRDAKNEQREPRSWVSIFFDNLTEPDRRLLQNIKGVFRYLFEGPVQPEQIVQSGAGFHTQTLTPAQVDDYVRRYKLGEYDAYINTRSNPDEVHAYLGGASDEEVAVWLYMVDRLQASQDPLEPPVDDFSGPLTPELIDAYLTALKKGYFDSDIAEFGEAALAEFLSKTDQEQAHTLREIERSKRGAPKRPAGKITAGEESDDELTPEIIENIYYAKIDDDPLSLTFLEYDIVYGRLRPDFAGGPRVGGGGDYGPGGRLSQEGGDDRPEARLLDGKVQTFERIGENLYYYDTKLTLWFGITPQGETFTVGNDESMEIVRQGGTTQEAGREIDPDTEIRLGDDESEYYAKPGLFIDGHFYYYDAEGSFNRGPGWYGTFKNEGQGSTVITRATRIHHGGMVPFPINIQASAPAPLPDDSTPAGRKQREILFRSLPDNVYYNPIINEFVRLDSSGKHLIQRDWSEFSLSETRPQAIHNFKKSLGYDPWLQYGQDVPPQYIYAKPGTEYMLAGDPYYYDETMQEWIAVTEDDQLLILEQAPVGYYYNDVTKISFRQADDGRWYGRDREGRVWVTDDTGFPIDPETGEHIDWQAPVNVPDPAPQPDQPYYYDEGTDTWVVVDPNASGGYRLEKEAPEGWYYNTITKIAFHYNEQEGRWIGNADGRMVYVDDTGFPIDATGEFVDWQEEGWLDRYWDLPGNKGLEPEAGVPRQPEYPFYAYTYEETTGRWIGYHDDGQIFVIDEEPYWFFERLGNKWVFYYYDEETGEIKTVDKNGAELELDEDLWARITIKGQVTTAERAAQIKAAAGQIANAAFRVMYDSLITSGVPGSPMGRQLAEGLFVWKPEGQDVVLEDLRGNINQYRVTSTFISSVPPSWRGVIPSWDTRYNTALDLGIAAAQDYLSGLEEEVSRAILVRVLQWPSRASGNLEVGYIQVLFDVQGRDIDTLDFGALEGPSPNDLPETDPSEQIDEFWLRDSLQSWLGQGIKTDIWNILVFIDTLLIGEFVLADLLHTAMRPVGEPGFVDIRGNKFIVNVDPDYEFPRGTGEGDNPFHNSYLNALEEGFLRDVALVMLRAGVSEQEIDRWIGILGLLGAILGTENLNADMILGLSHFIEFLKSLGPMSAGASPAFDLDDDIAELARVALETMAETLEGSEIGDELASSLSARSFDIEHINLRGYLIGTSYKGSEDLGAGWQRLYRDALMAGREAARAARSGMLAADFLIVRGTVRPGHQLGFIEVGFNAAGTATSEGDELPLYGTPASDELLPEEETGDAEFLQALSAVFGGLSLDTLRAIRDEFPAENATWRLLRMLADTTNADPRKVLVALVEVGLDDLEVLSSLLGFASLSSLFSLLQITQADAAELPEEFQPYLPPFPVDDSRWEDFSFSFDIPEIGDALLIAERAVSDIYEAMSIYAGVNIVYRPFQEEEQDGIRFGYRIGSQRLLKGNASRAYEVAVGVAFAEAYARIDAIGKQEALHLEYFEQGDTLLIQVSFIARYEEETGQWIVLGSAGQLPPTTYTLEQIELRNEMVLDVADFAEGVLREYCPVRTGRMKASIRQSVRSELLEKRFGGGYLIGARVLYAPFVATYRTAVEQTIERTRQYAQGYDVKIMVMPSVVQLDDDAGIGPGIAVRLGVEGDAEFDWGGNLGGMSAPETEDPGDAGDLPFSLRF